MAPVNERSFVRATASLIALESGNNYCHYSLISAHVSSNSRARATTDKGTSFHLFDRFGLSMTNWNAPFSLCESGFKFPLRNINPV
jgi:hypothetical protein